MKTRDDLYTEVLTKCSQAMLATLNRDYGRAEKQVLMALSAVLDLQKVQAAENAKQEKKVVAA